MSNRDAAMTGAKRRGGQPVRPMRKKRPALAPSVTSIDYKDTTLLRTFTSDRGKIRSRRVTGLTPQQQRLVARAIKNAREMALLPYGTTQH